MALSLCFHNKLQDENLVSFTFVCTESISTQNFSFILLVIVFSMTLLQWLISEMFLFLMRSSEYEAF